jgi:hypothetical protein
VFVGTGVKVAVETSIDVGVNVTGSAVGDTGVDVEVKVGVSVRSEDTEMVAVCVGEAGTDVEGRFVNVGIGVKVKDCDVGEAGMDVGS